MGAIPAPKWRREAEGKGGTSPQSPRPAPPSPKESDTRPSCGDEFDRTVGVDVRDEADMGAV